MEKMKMYFMALAAMIIILSSAVQAQGDSQKSKFTTGADLYSNYIFRGTKFGKGPSVQPNLKFISGGFTAGVWGSFDAFGYAETDPYISYSFPFGLSLGITDYYYPGLELFDVSAASGSQAIEINSGFAKGAFSLSANYIINEAAGAASAGGDTYFQAGYAFSSFSLFAGAGTGWHTSDGEFDLCNIGISTSRELKLTDTFSIPVLGQVILNPDREQLFVVIGFTF
jgi:uncharacterized protein (TIGR02001 family)